ncbi:MAG: alpha/beta hydrolase [Firmicutes bacterium]|nr:alpha/beta hydrolase [Bacillota bacterium]
MVVKVKKEEKVKSFDDTLLHFIKDEVEESKAVIIIVHGFCEHLGRYDYVTDKLNEFGFSVYRFDNRGHGKSGGKRGYLNDFNDYIKDLDVIVNLANKENPKKSIFILGHSMGGFITSSYGIKYENKVSGEILSGAATERPDILTGIKGSFFKGLNKIMPNLTLKNKLYNKLSRDDKISDDFLKDPLNLMEASLKIHVEFLINGIDWLNHNVHKYNLPCLIIHGGNDKIVNKEASENFYNNISSKDKKLKIYDKLYHEILNENIRDEILKDINKWIEQRI